MHASIHASNPTLPSYLGLCPRRATTNGKPRWYTILSTRRVHDGCILSSAPPAPHVQLNKMYLWCVGIESLPCSVKREWSHGRCGGVSSGRVVGVVDLRGGDLALDLDISTFDFEVEVEKKTLIALVAAASCLVSQVQQQTQVVYRFHSSKPSPSL